MLLFYNVLDAFGLSCSHLLQGLLLLGLCPIAQHLATEFSELFNRHRFGFIGRSTVGYCLVHFVGYLLQSPIRMWTIGETLIQTYRSAFFFWQFIAHELLYLYITSKSTISKLRIFARHFQSHPCPWRTLPEKTIREKLRAMTKLPSLRVISFSMLVAFNSAVQLHSAETSTDKANATTDAKPDSKSDTKVFKEPTPTVTSHSITVGGKTLQYHATAGYILL